MSMCYHGNLVYNKTLEGHFSGIRVHTPTHGVAHTHLHLVTTKKEPTAALTAVIVLNSL